MSRFIPAFVSAWKPHVQTLFAKVRYGAQTFRWRQTRYRYFAHSYNYAWANERAVEVPIVWQAVQQEYQKGHSEEILEVGNVLAHYFPIHHSVVDKYEVAPGVLNQDIVDFHPHRQFKLIVAISTLEHVGWDETPRNKTKIGRAITHLQSLLQPGGRLLITLPVGYSDYSDTYVVSSNGQKLEWTALRRLDAANHWQQVVVEKNLTAPYNHPYPNANVILVGEYTRPKIGRRK